MIKFTPPSPPKNSAQRGNIFFMLFGAVALVGAIGVGASNHVKGIVGSMSDVTRKTVAEEKMMGGARLSVMAATDVQANGGDCDSDGMVEPLPYVNAGTAPKPAGGGWMPADIGAEALDPWGQKYGYCVWDSGADFDEAGCGGPGALRLRGSPNPTHTVVAIISPGKNRAFETTCNAYVDTTPADGNPDTALITRGTGYDDIVLEYTYEDASGLSGEDLWKIRDTDPDTATIDKNIEVSGSGQFDGAINLMEKGLILPTDPGDNSVTGACAATTDQQLRINGGVSPPALEICYDNTWTPVSMGGGNNSSLGTEDAKLIASDAAANDNFGNDVAIDGNTAIVGAYAENGGPGSGMGAAYIFVKSGGTWVQQQKLTASDAAAGAYFGWSVDISGDSVVVGARADSGSALAAGAAYVFTRSGGVWTQQQKLIPSDVVSVQYSGYNVSIDDDTVAVAAPGDNGGSGANSGAVYVYTRSGVTWTQQQKLKASDAAASDFLGTRAGLDLAGDTIIAGAEASDAAGLNSGAVYVFTRSGGVWSQQQKFVGSDTEPNDAFGGAVAIDGNTAAITARLDDDVANNSGAVYIFNRSGSVWTQSAKLKADDADDSDLMGTNGIAIAGNIVLVGVNGDDDGGSATGSAYVFKNTDGSWEQIFKLNASDPQVSNSFGASVGLSEDTGVIGASYGDDNVTPILNTGAAYIFEGLCGGSCVVPENYQPAVSHPLAADNFLGCTSGAQGPFKPTGSASTTMHRVFHNGSYLFSADQPGNNLSAISLNAAGGFTTIASIATGGLQYAITANDTYTFSTQAASLNAYSFNGTAFTAAGSTALSEISYSVYTQGGYVFVANGTKGLVVYQYDGTAFTEITKYNSPGNAYHIWGDGTYLYLSDQGGGLHVLTFDGTALTIIDTVTSGGNVQSSAGDGNYIYAASSTGVFAYSFTNNTLTEVASYTGATDARSVWTNGTAILVGYNSTAIFRAFTFNGTTFNLLAEYPGVSGNNLPDIAGDGTYVYAAYSGVRPLTAFSGFGCGESMSPDPAVVIAANKYRGKISAGAGPHACGIKSDNTAWCWGVDNTLQLGNGPLLTTALGSPSLVDSALTANNFVQIAAGGGAAGGHSCALKPDGTAWCWGSDSNGQLGNDAVAGSQASPYPVSGGHRFSKITTGPFTTCGIRSDGTAWCWGQNVEGQLGDGGTTEQPAPVQVVDAGPWVDIFSRGATTCAIKTDGSLWCWGRGTNGRLGNGGIVNSSVPVPVAEPGPWVHITVGSNSSAICGIKMNGTLWCWGENAGGQFGNGTTTNSSIPVRMPDPGPWIDVAQTYATSFPAGCGIKVDGSAWCWGGGANGRLGNGGTANSLVPVRVSDPGPWATIAMGSDYACGMKVDGSAWCWGVDTSGELGNGAVLTADQTTPSRVYNFSNLEPWQWDATATTMSKAVTTAPVVIPPSSAVGYTDATGGFSFNNGTQSILRNPNGNAELLVQSLLSTGDVQISLKAASAGNTRTFGMDGTTGYLKIGLNNAGLTTWANAMTAQMLIAFNGNIAMGTALPGAKLGILNGGLRVGMDMRACTPSRAGTLRFDESQDVDFKYCNGTAWVDF